MKIMKYTLWATVGLSLLFASCESILDINPKDRLTTKDYFTNEEQLQLYSNQFYSNNFPGDGDIYRDDADMLIVSPLSDEVSVQRGRQRNGPHHRVLHGRGAGLPEVMNHE
mgnify:CR=1 FL=1